MSLDRDKFPMLSDKEFTLLDQIAIGGPTTRELKQILAKVRKHNVKRDTSDDWRKIINE